MRMSILLFSVIFIFSSHADTAHCTSDDRDYARFWNNYYDPEEAYEFGLTIQNLVKDKDLKGLFAKVDGELQHGPKRDVAPSRTFGDSLNEAWVQAVLDTAPPCSPVGWRVFMLGNGMIWYNKTDKGWAIFSINSVNENN